MERGGKKKRGEEMRRREGSREGHAVREITKDKRKGIGKRE